MSKTAHKPSSPLVEAALALEEELRRVSVQSRETRRLPLNSERNLDRTASKLAELGTIDERLQPLVRALMDAVQALVQGQQEEAATLAAWAAELQQRRAVFRQLQEMFEMLAGGARQLNELVQEFAAARRGDEDAPAGEAPSLASVLELMNVVIDSADQVAATAKQEDFLDIARQAESLRRQITAARSKLSHLTPSAGDSPVIVH